MRRRRSWLCFFFFQAEDGIRDKLVTGVQTCALPISPRAEIGAVTPGELYRVKPGATTKDLIAKRAGPPRSEERRVGKSVDLGGRRIIKKKKKKESENANKDKKGEITHKAPDEM